MPITFSVTCDTDEELARFLENLRFGQEQAFGAMGLPAAVRQRTTSTEVAPKKNNKKSTSAKSFPTKTAKAKSTLKAKKPKGSAVSKAGRKSGKLIPLIEKGIQTFKDRGAAFRAREVTEWVMRKDPTLNESSVTTGVSKLLGQSGMDWEQIKDAVGRPYKLYKP